MRRSSAVMATFDSAFSGSAPKTKCSGIVAWVCIARRIATAASCRDESPCVARYCGTNLGRRAAGRYSSDPAQPGDRMVGDDPRLPTPCHSSAVNVLDPQFHASKLRFQLPPTPDISAQVSAISETAPRASAGKSTNPRARPGRSPRAFAAGASALAVKQLRRRWRTRALTVW